MDAVKRRRGREPKERPLSARIIVGITMDDRAWLDYLAEKEHRSISEIMRIFIGRLRREEEAVNSRGGDWHVLHDVIMN